MKPKPDPQREANLRRIEEKLEALGFLVRRNEGSVHARTGPLSEGAIDIFADDRGVESLSLRHDLPVEDVLAILSHLAPFLAANLPDAPE